MGCSAIEPATGHACKGDDDESEESGATCANGVHWCGALDTGCRTTWRTPPHPEATHGLDGRALAKGCGDPDCRVAWDDIDGPDACNECCAAGLPRRDLAGRALGDKERP